MSKRNTSDRVSVETPVGQRMVAAGQPWHRGEGRGHTREFIHGDETLECKTCHEELVETEFPTLTVPRKNGRTRGLSCRGCVKETRERNARKAKRQAAAKKAAATRSSRKAA